MNEMVLARMMIIAVGVALLQLCDPALAGAPAHPPSAHACAAFVEGASWSSW